MKNYYGLFGEAELRSILATGAIIVHFIKLNGDERQMACTLALRMVPEPVSGSFFGAHPKKTATTIPNLITAWDLNAKAWRSFYADRVVEVSVVPRTAWPLLDTWNASPNNHVESAESAEWPACEHNNGQPWRSPYTRADLYEEQI